MCIIPASFSTSILIFISCSLFLSCFFIYFFLNDLNMFYVRQVQVMPNISKVLKRKPLYQKFMSNLYSSTLLCFHLLDNKTEGLESLTVNTMLYCFVWYKVIEHKMQYIVVVFDQHLKFKILCTTLVVWCTQKNGRSMNHIGEGV